MANATIKDEFKKRKVAFGTSGKPLGERSQSDINDLAVIAHQSKNPKLLEMFVEPMPSLEDLKKKSVDEQLASNPNAAGSEVKTSGASGPIAGQK